jgi:MFS family permease
VFPWRSGRICVTGLASRDGAPHHRRMEETWVTLGVVCMGLGGVVAGLVGVVLPEGRRLGALFGLIAGAGVGVAAIGLGALLNENKEPSELTFFVASLLGLLAVSGSSWLVWKRAIESRQEPGEQPG